jgi:IclR family mhp operon transcriptional activator
VPLLDSAAGRVHLAFCSDAERDGLLGRLARTQRADLERVLADVRIQGYATVTRTQRLVDEVSAGVPVSLHDRLLAVLTVRFVSSAVPLKSGLERFLPKLRQCAAKIGALFSELPLKDQTRAQATSAPDATA